MLYQILAQAENSPLDLWTTVGGTGALIGLFWIVVRELRKDVFFYIQAIKEKDAHIAMLNSQYREDGLRNLEVLKDVADLVNTLAQSQDGARKELGDGFNTLTRHIDEAVGKIETAIQRSK